MQEQLSGQILKYYQTNTICDQKERALGFVYKIIQTKLITAG